MLGLACLADAGAARAQGDEKKPDSVEKKVAAFLTEMQELKRALDRKKAELAEIMRLHDALLQKQAELADTEAYLKKRTAKMRAEVDKLLPKAPKPFEFPAYYPPIKPPLIIFPFPKPSPPPCPWPPPWPPPGIGIYPFPGSDRYPGGIVPFGTPGGPTGAPQSLAPMPGRMLQR